jgi:copper chaperone CopZ
MQRTGIGTVLAALAVLTLSSALQAQAPPPLTITVPDMHCLGCAKKMANQLYQVPGVAKVQASVETTSLIVTPKAQQIPSPRGLWEAVEKAGYRPSRLEGPNGTFTQKPNA